MFTTKRNNVLADGGMMASAVRAHMEMLAEFPIDEEAGGNQV